MQYVDYSVAEGIARVVMNRPAVNVRFVLYPNCF